ncbi:MULTISPECIES: formate dehydrogenase accessory sulfurtransferase FdhD [Chryseobacterium]|uniref:formate dehydrogenase accessory sulfurtransferase FdhD n=1 Tax=Chryseobacterium TaxID=59732 RepID=UPI000487FD71|nr:MULTISPECIES: formate dehydrogenase accessory sulfurtransferase FdhD [Chryseobacterium]ATN04927.1 sulfurtransferase FdhD [Chryseobacterium indologenes]AYY86322.1 formate dehydrogenase accessory sulfurtransferase FdhD [Chryseobacterium indologenes]QIX83226.1 formate dehydrogenase accessory sulfurtransferase FdhD [Chryseobacterium indologenes]TLX25379.1 formate dehydrogenase accessory sulfurtransferase FdhD [Chryseobacterium indologenes]UDQ52909.1 formate dehydrogenase accessory sulfurtransfe
MKTNLLENQSVRQIDITKVKDNDSFLYADDIAVEEPLEIRVSYGIKDQRENKNISVTMRTPGNDEELAAGFLFTEGIISGNHQIKNIQRPEAECSRNQENVVIIDLADGFIPELMKADRNFYTTSSCGVCGKGSIDSIRTVSSFQHIQKDAETIAFDTLYQLSENLRSFQNNFSATGGIHASGIFDYHGNLLALREDVGRHNALDKLIGHALFTNQLPLKNTILVLSGRASFELIQKAAMAGISIVAAIGAPSSLAIDLAKEFDMTLLGFLRENRFNIYNTASNHRIIGK